MANYLLPAWHDTTKRASKPTRDGLGLGLIEAAKKDKHLYTICADLTESTRIEWFKKEFPKRFVQIGVSEQALAGIAAGMALTGKNVFIASYAAFSPGRNWEQIRTTACLQNQRVKIIGSHAGVSVGPDGATHQMLEDIALMRVLPNMIVLAPCDANEAKNATIALGSHNGPGYIRLAREKSPVFTRESMPFQIGKSHVLAPGDDIALFACGPLVFEALTASMELRKLGIAARVINVSSIKPLDEKTVLAAARDCGVAITIEEGQIAGGMGSAICEFLSENNPIPVLRIGMQDRFGETGKPQELLEHFGLTAPHIIKAAKQFIKKKRGL